jgi:hypothetical protein
LGIPLLIEIIGSEGGLWQGRQREKILIPGELLWWLTGRKYKLGKVLEKRGEEIV